MFVAYGHWPVPFRDGYKYDCQRTFVACSFNFKTDCCNECYTRCYTAAGMGPEHGQRQEKKVKGQE